MRDPNDPIPPRPACVAEDAILRTLRVPPESQSMRLDRFLTTQLRSTSRTRAQEIITASAFSWDGRRMRASERVRAEQIIVLWRPALDEEPPPTALTELYEDEYLIVVDKPAMMTVHPTARHHRHTVIKQLSEQRPTEKLTLIHRLDRDTSGVLLVARSKEADREFKMGIEKRVRAAARLAEMGMPIARSADKTYLAITWGVPQNGIITESLESDPSPLRVKMCVAAPGKGLAARTGVTVLEAVDGYALVRCDLHTGRQHQIRVHLAHVGCPIVGDKLYGPDEALHARGADRTLTEEDLLELELPRQALHAAEYRVDHPFTGEELELKAPLPQDMLDFWHEKGGQWGRS